MTAKKSKALEDACRLLVSAYKRGDAEEHMDWDDVDQAYVLARRALRMRG